MLNLNTVEKELTSLLDYDKKNWTHFYILLKKVEDEKLWESKYKSFNQWVKDFCKKTKTHESIVWNRKKAGRVYESYQKIKAQKGEEVANIEDTNVSADALVILDKINRYDEEIASNLVDKVLNKEITNKDLREVYKGIRPENISHNPHFRTEKGERGEKQAKESNSENKITANKIVSTLCNIEWLGIKKERKYFKSAFEQDKYRVFTEFPLYTGTSKRSRRVDLLIAENIQTEHIWELNLHGIEIKVSKSDLLNDTKYTEYAEFVDYMWLAVTEELVEEGLKNTFEDCGIISIKDNKAMIVKQAKKLDSYRRMDTLTNIALKLI
ncbi:MAG: MmcB family DNA repair protein [Romboutsia timonensis]|nr:MmcB family DNA repair protein [Romboutsia timonensis]